VYRDRPTRAIPDDTQTIWILGRSDDRSPFFGVSRMTRTTEFTQVDAVSLGKLSRVFVKFRVR
jgi:hypothetical protein